MIVATWNVENLFRPGVDAGPPNEDIYDAKLTALATVVADIGPDVLAVQEVGQPEALRELADRLDGDWHLALSEFPDSRGIRVGVRSRLELDQVEHVRAFRSPGRRRDPPRRSSPARCQCARGGGPAARAPRGER